MTDWVYLNGQYLNIEDATVSVQDRGFLYGDGLFETLRVYKGHPFRHESHFSRLCKGADQIGLPVTETLETLIGVVRELLERNQLQEGILRIQLTRGPAPPGPGIPVKANPTLFIQTRPLNPLPTDSYAKGVRICLFPHSALVTGTLDHQIKSCNYLSNILIRNAAAKRDCFEGIMLDENQNITEGSISNLFIIKDGILRTPPPGPSVLAGVTREVVLQTATICNVNPEEISITETELRQADEIFLTNSAIEVLPVTGIESQPVGDGSPGEITRKLMDQFAKTVEEEVGSC